MSPRGARAYWRALAASGLGALAWTTAARAQAPCPIFVVPQGASEWEAAARAAEQRSFGAASTSHDCQSAHVTVLTDGSARLDFATTAGEHAQRLLQTPAELGPALEALLVTVTPPPAAAPEPRPAAKAEPPSVTQAASAEAHERPHLTLGGGAGARFTLGHKYLAPAVTLRATGVFEHWELGLSAEWDAAFARLSGATPAGFAMSALVVEALFGRREQVRRFDVSYGFELGIGSVSSSADAEAGSTGARALDASQQRVGFYAGARYPRNANTRLTLDLAADAALSGLRGAATSAAHLPPFPRYGTSLSLGVETVAL